MPRWQLLQFMQILVFAPVVFEWKPFPSVRCLEVQHSCWVSSHFSTSCFYSVTCAGNFHTETTGHLSFQLNFKRGHLWSRTCRCLSEAWPFVTMLGQVAWGHLEGREKTGSLRLPPKCNIPTRAGGCQSWSQKGVLALGLRPFSSSVL